MTNQGDAAEAVARAINTVLADLLFSLIADPGERAARGELACRTILDRLASRSAPDKADEVVAWVNPRQLAQHTDPEPTTDYHQEAGHYLPLRKSKGGKFTMPLYAHPTPSDQEKLVGEEWRYDLDALPNGIHEIAFDEGFGNASVHVCSRYVASPTLVNGFPVPRSEWRYGYQDCESREVNTHNRRPYAWRPLPPPPPITRARQTGERS